MYFIFCIWKYSSEKQLCRLPQHSLATSEEQERTLGLQRWEWGRCGRRQGQRRGGWRRGSDHSPADHWEDMAFILKALRNDIRSFEELLWLSEQIAGRKGRGGWTREKAVITVQPRDDGGIDQCGSNRSGEKWSDSRYILKVEIFWRIWQRNGGGADR